MSSETVARPPVTTWRQIFGVIGGAVLLAVALVPVALGFCTGYAFWALRWLAAAFLVGFHAGNAGGEADE